MLIWVNKLKYRLGIMNTRGRKRRKHMYYYRYGAAVKKVVFIGLAVLACMYLIITIENRINPLIYDMSISNLSSMVIRECNTAVSELIESENVDYAEIVDENIDKEGKLKSLSVNYKNLNLFKSKLAVDVQRRIDNINSVDITIPFMSLISDRFYSAVGFPVKLRVLTDENIDIQFFDEFTSAGVNQTRHRIYVRVVTEVSVNVPVRGRGDDIVTDIPIAETIIVGDVPSTYLNFQ